MPLHRANIATIVPKGIAELELTAIKKKFKKRVMKKIIPGKNRAVKTVVLFTISQFSPAPIIFNTLVEKYPATIPIKTNNTIKAVTIPPLLAGDKNPNKAKTIVKIPIDKICTPEPIKTEKNTGNFGLLNISPCICFHPVSSTSSGSVELYLTQSFRSVLVRIIATITVKKITISKEFIIENQWISPLLVILI